MRAQQQQTWSVLPDPLQGPVFNIGRGEALKQRMKCSHPLADSRRVYTVSKYGSVALDE